MIRQKLKSLVHAAGFDVRRRSDAYLAQTDPLHALDKLLRGQPKPLLFDVGANRGQTVGKLLSRFPGATIHAFEPGDEAFADLTRAYGADSRVVRHHFAVGSKSGTTTFYAMKDDRTSSLARPGEAAQDFSVEVKGAVQVPIRTLDDVIEEMGSPHVDLLKMDIQGAEVAALTGAAKTLGRRGISTVYAEVMFTKVYEEQATFGALADLLGRYGFELVGLYGLAYARDRLHWADALFALPNRA
jgi:FkbM family methyltransferase